jgi:hypothetical protein
MLKMRRADGNFKAPMKRPPKDKTGQRKRKSIDQRIREADWPSKWMLAQYGPEAKEFTNDPVKSLGFNLTKMGEIKQEPVFQRLMTEPEFKSGCDFVRDRWNHLFDDVVRDGPGVLEKLTKAMRRAQKLKLDHPSKPNIRERILDGYYSDNSSIPELAKEFGVDESHVRRIKARIFPSDK